MPHSHLSCHFFWLNTRDYLTLGYTRCYGNRSHRRKDQGAIRWWWNKTLIPNLCSFLFLTARGALGSRAHLGARPPCWAIVKRAFSEHVGLALRPAPHKWTWNRARFICVADTKDKVTSECGETKEAPFSGALTCLTTSLAHLTSLALTVAVWKWSVACVSSRLWVWVFVARTCASRFSFPMAPRGCVAGCWAKNSTEWPCKTQMHTQTHAQKKFPLLKQAHKFQTHSANSTDRLKWIHW